MASTLCRLPRHLSKICRQTTLLSPVRVYSDQPHVNPTRGRVVLPTICTYRLPRHLSKICRQTTLLSSVRVYSDQPHVNPTRGRVASQDAQMPDALGHAVGSQRFELLANLSGQDDPFEFQVKKKAAGTKKEPTLIPSAHESRVIGCICEEDALHINWMNLYKGEPARCGCGYWFKLTEVEFKDYGQV